MKAGALSLALILLAGCATSSGQPTPRGIAQQFCKVVQASNDAAFLPLAGPELSLLVQKAQQDNASIAERAPTEKPPLGDGLPLTSQPDYAPICKVGTITPTTLGKTVIEIHHGFTGENASQSYTDKLVLDAYGLIEDVLFAPDYVSGLRGALHGAFASY